MADLPSDNSPSRSLVRDDAGNLPTTLGPELEEAAGTDEHMFGPDKLRSYIQHTLQACALATLRPTVRNL